MARVTLVDRHFRTLWNCLPNCFSFCPIALWPWLLLLLVIRPHLLIGSFMNSVASDSVDKSATFPVNWPLGMAASAIWRLFVFGGEASCPIQGGRSPSIRGVSSCSARVMWSPMELTEVSRVRGDVWYCWEWSVPSLTCRCDVSVTEEKSRLSVRSVALYLSSNVLLNGPVVRVSDTPGVLFDANLSVSCCPLMVVPSGL